jgi:hypothetical protein
MAIVSYDRKDIPPPTEERLEELRALAERPDDEIDYSDIPKTTDFSGWMTPDELNDYLAARREQVAAV